MVQNINNKTSIKITILLMAFLLVAVFNSPNKAFGAEMNLTKQLEVQGIGLDIQDEWLQEENKTGSTKEKNSKIIHNNGKPLKQDILENEPNGDNNELIAVYQTEVDGTSYEKYYFSNNTENNIDEIIGDVVKLQGDIKNDPKGFVKKLSKESNSDVTPSAVQPHPGGGYWRTYSWNFYNVLNIKSGTFTTNLNLHRQSANANINGKTGSVWDVHAFNEYEVAHYRINQQITRMDVGYTNQQLLSYGPYNDAGFDVSVNLSKIISNNSWTFNVGAVITNNLSSIANKYGRWRWNHTQSSMQNPFVTEPGIRVSNTVGVFSVKTSHTFNTTTGVNHSTGVVTTSLPDR